MMSFAFSAILKATLVCGVVFFFSHVCRRIRGQRQDDEQAYHPCPPRRTSCTKGRPLPHEQAAIEATRVRRGFTGFQASFAASLGRGSWHNTHDSVNVTHLVASHAHEHRHRR